MRISVRTASLPCEREGDRRRHKFRIARFPASGKARSLRCSAFPQPTRCAAVGGFAALRMRRTPCGCCAGLGRGPRNFGTFCGMSLPAAAAPSGADGAPGGPMVRWGEDEQGSGRRFRRQAELEPSGLCEDDVPPGDPPPLSEGDENGTASVLSLPEQKRIPPPPYWGPRPSPVQAKDMQLAATKPAAPGFSPLLTAAGASRKHPGRAPAAIQVRHAGPGRRGRGEPGGREEPRPRSRGDFRWSILCACGSSGVRRTAGLVSILLPIPEESL